MTVKEKVITNISKTIAALEKIKEMFEKDDCPGNEEWTNAAEPLNEIINVLNQRLYLQIKDKEWNQHIYLLH